MSKEAIKLALEALERSVATCFDRYAHEQVICRPEHFVNQAITALQEALAEQPAQQCRRELSADGSFVCDCKPPQRTWQGLTEEEIEQGCKESWVTEQAWQSAVWWAEAKLRSKNT